MQVDFSDNYFELFGLEPAPEVHTERLANRYRELQRALHPDRFAARPDAERRWSMQAASFVNEAYQTLRNPLPRASYLLSMHGIALDEETDTRMAPAFLMEQMELRESLEVAESAADPWPVLDELRERLAAQVRGCEQRFATAAGDGDWQEARDTVRQWQFLDKLGREVTEIEERIDH